MRNLLKLIINYIKLPFQLYSFSDPVKTTLELKKIDARHLVSYDNNTMSYFSNNMSYDEYSHDVDNMFKNSCIYMHLYQLTDDEGERLFRWIYMNTHGGATLTNGTSRLVHESGKLKFHSNNINLETIASLNLLMLRKSCANKLEDNFYRFLKNLKENDYALNYATNPGGALEKPFLKALEEAGYNNLKVQLRNPDTDMSLGCSSDAAVVLLATLAIMKKRIGDEEYSKLFDKFNKVYGYGLKIYGTTNCYSTIVSLYVLYKLTKEDKYLNLLKKKFEVVDNIETEIGNYLYAELIGVNKSV